MTPSRYVVLRSDDIEPFTPTDDSPYHSQHIFGREITNRRDYLLNCGTLDGHRDLPGESHPDNDEIYYVVKGSSLVDLGGDPHSGEGSLTYRLEVGMAVFIPAGTFHRLRNDSDDEFVIVAIWPQDSVPGGNSLHDLRQEAWGTAFRLREGRTLIQDEVSIRVVEPETQWDPLLA